MSIPLIPTASMWLTVGSWITTTLLAGAPWIALMMLVQIIGIRYYIIQDLDIAKRIQRRLTYSSSADEHNRPSGWSCGRWFVLYLEHLRGWDRDQITIWLIATNETYRRLTEQTEIMDTATSTSTSTPTLQKQSITILHRTGSYHSVEFSRRTIHLAGYEPRPKQRSTMETLSSICRTTGHAVAFLHGAPGTGKSMVGLLLAGSMSATYCNNLRLWQPGDTLARLHSEAAPTAESPLVLVIDEVDVALVAIHAGIPPHKHFPIPVADKASWNALFDDISHGMYPWTIIILTSNRGPEFIRGLDASYIRPGRVDLIAEID